MIFSSLIKVSKKIILTFILVLSTLTIFPFYSLAQTNYSCEDADATAIQCIQDAISLKEKDGKLDEIEFFLNKAIDKVDVISLVTAKELLAELLVEQGNKTESERLIKETKALRQALKFKTPPTDTCPRECIVNIVPGKKYYGEFDGFGGCSVCPGALEKNRVSE